MADPRVMVVEDLPACGLTEFFVLTATDGREVELRRTASGAVAVASYSSLESLVVCCGWGQPWVLMRPERLADAAKAAGATQVAVDVPPPEGHRYPEPAEFERAELEPLAAAEHLTTVYIPSRPFREGQQRAELELQLDRSGRRLLLAFSSAEALAEGCCPYQSWVAIDVARLSAVADEVGADRVVFNPSLVENARYPAPVVDWTAPPKK